MNHVLNYAHSLNTITLNALVNQVRGPVSAARAWNAAERYLTLEEFGDTIRDPMYSPLLNFSEWEVRLSSHP